MSTDDLWTALLSDDPEELDEALEAAPPPDGQSVPQESSRALGLRRVVARLLDAAVVLPVGYLLAQAAKADGQSASAGAQDLPAVLVAATEAAAGGLLLWFVYEAVAVARWGAPSARPLPGSGWSQQSRPSSPADNQFQTRDTETEDHPTAAAIEAALTYGVADDDAPSWPKT